MKLYIFAAAGIVVIVAAFLFLQQRSGFDIPQGEAVPLEESELGGNQEISNEITPMGFQTSSRQISVTDGVKHSIPTEDILSGGPGKDGIPSIDNPKFISLTEADEFLDLESIGLGFVWKGEARFYPYQILVWHELVNDTVQGDPVLITYCPLCATGVVFERKVNGQAAEFGVSGLLWQSNLLMYNRTSNPDNESLWSQVLGEAVLGEDTGAILKVLSADTVKYGAWKQAHPDTSVLSRDTGTLRSYGSDPYGNYYTDETVGFGATFNDDRLHPKEFVLGVEIAGQFKAYRETAIRAGTTTDNFAGQELTITKDETGTVRIKDEQGEEVRIIAGFWFSWLAVHPETELYK